MSGLEGTSPATGAAGTGRAGAGRWWPRGAAAAAAVIMLGALAIVGGTRPATGADNPYQRGPDPTPASVSAGRGTFATAQVSVGAGNGFGGGVIYYPTDTSQGTFGAIAVVPGYTATWAAEGAWMGHWLASYGFVVIGIDTNTRNDWDTARGTQLLAALDYLTQRSSVRDRVDATRTAVMGHSMGGGGAAYASLQRPSLKTSVGLAPFSPSQNLTTTRVPTMLLSGQNDGTVTPSSVQNLYNGIPAGVEKAYLELTGAGHGFPTSNNPTMMRTVIPWFKIFVDSDTRYTQFLCPLADSNGIRTYQSTCPLVPSTPPTTTTTPTSTTTTSTTSTTPTTTTTTPQPGGACSATYRTVNSWSGGYQGEVTVTAGTSAVTGWTVRWSLGSGQTISQVWNGTLTVDGPTASVRNVSYNGSLGANASTTFGFIGGGTPPTSTLSCTSP
ncbi:cellulose binding domain-containing protein [Saccharothrix sp. S26]|uniref:poly(ethylene terephthalate) hydrolase family protein n=1 Tax=Saccharothrix sp. S26 TaxID=2907215 RepID=UPI001F29F255|nr:cellulose binding domain-containing protein [Saccharothrix sp. S26]MCE6998688.1 cellulose binding domain-containing protein [Saccharothrix sp. S26]